jgi:hypothetical protein
VIADDDEHGIGCQITNVLERGAEVGLDDDRVRLVHRYGIDERILRLRDRDDVEPTGSESSLYVVDAAGRDHAEPAAGRVPIGGRSGWQGGTVGGRSRWQGGTIGDRGRWQGGTFEDRHWLVGSR